MTPFQLEALYGSPNALAPHYSKFRVAERLLLTGHSHQAWPDCGFEAQAEAWLDAARYVDDKWQRALAQADAVRQGFARLLGDTTGSIALASSTHDLVVRWLSALPLKARPRIVTTDAEFHTIRRQLDRLAEEGIEIVKVCPAPADSVADRLSRATDDGTAAVMVSSVFYHNGHMVPHLDQVLARCERVGAALLVDAYHALNVVPFSLERERLEGAFVVGGGYKYCQLGEGNCFLRVPADGQLRPVITGWLSEFGSLSEPSAEGRVAYGPGPDRFAGATYDPTSHYRGARVFQFFAEQGLTPARLREVSQHQIAQLAARFDALDLDPGVITRDRSVPLNVIAGFLALRAPRAADLVARLRRRAVLADSRGDLLRLGPAPYLSDQQLESAVEGVAAVARER